LNIQYSNNQIFRLFFRAVSQSSHRANPADLPTKVSLSSKTYRPSKTYRVRPTE